MPTFQGLEQLEPRMMMSATVPAGYLLVQDDLRIHTNNNTPTLSVDMVAGANYYAVASGTFKVGSNSTHIADAEYHKHPTQGWKDLTTISGYNTDMGLDDASGRLGHWGTRQSDYTYGQSFTPNSTAPLELFYNDVNLYYYRDNSGHLLLDLYQQQVVDLAVDSDNDGDLDADDDAIEDDNTRGRWITLGGYAPLDVTLAYEISQIGSGSNYIELEFNYADDLELWTQANGQPAQHLLSGTRYEAGSIGLGPDESTTLLVKAITADVGLTALPITATAIVDGFVGTGGLQDRVHVRAFETTVDLDVDTLNENGFDSPDHTIYEEHVEALPEAGKYLLPLWGDRDADGILDNLDLGGVVGARFAPLEFKVDGPDGVAHEVRFDYDPQVLRLWRDDASVDRTSPTALLQPGGAFALASFSTVEAAGDEWSRVYMEALGGELGDADGQPSLITLAARHQGTVDAPWSEADSVNVVPVEVALRVDADRDGRIEFAMEDDTDAGSPYRFWLNNDADRWVTSVVGMHSDRGFDDFDDAGDEDPADPDFDFDATDAMIGFASEPSETDEQRLAVVQRDLEDFTRLGLWLPRDIDYSWIKFSLVGQNAPTLRLWPSVGDGDPAANTLSSTVHVTDAVLTHGIADQLWTSYAASPHGSVTRSAFDFDGPLRLEPGQFNTIPWSSIVGDSRPGWNDLYSEARGFVTVPIMFEGISAGVGELVVTALDTNGTAVGEATVHLDLRDIKQFYEHWSVGDYVASTWQEVAGIPTQTTDSAPVASRGEFGDDYIMFVHVWRMEPFDRRSFAETAYKRLWWQGYEGRFGLFSWPTDFHEGGLWDTVWDAQNFDRSERHAYHAGAGLRTMLTRLNQEGYAGRVNVMAHSMGNVVMSEALRLEAQEEMPTQLVHTYVASQAAMAAHAYDKRAPIRDHTGPTPYRTPEVYAAYPPTGKPYFADIDLAAGDIVNFYNIDDYALSSWQWNQDTKPDVGWEYSNITDSWHRWQVEWVPAKTLTFPSDTYEIFAHIAEARSLAAGAQVDLDGPFNQGRQIDLKTNFGFTGVPEDHSGQFNSTNINRAAYWKQLMATFGT